MSASRDRHVDVYRLYPRAHNSVGEELKTVISVGKEGKFYVAIDPVTNVADQGATEEEAVERLKKGLEEHYQILVEKKTGIR